jgi:Flp pilus assembly protein TadD
MTSEIVDQVLDQKMSWAKALGVPEGVVEVFALLGLQHYEQGRIEDARVMFQAAVALDAAGYMGHAGLGVLALVKDDLPAAEEHLLRAHALNPNDTAVCCNLGEVMLRQERLAEARQFLSQSAALDPQLLDCYANRARGILQAIP